MVLFVSKAVLMDVQVDSARRGTDSFGRPKASWILVQSAVAEIIRQVSPRLLHESPLSPVENRRFIDERHTARTANGAPPRQTSVYEAGEQSAQSPSMDSVAKANGSQNTRDTRRFKINRCGIDRKHTIEVAGYSTAGQWLRIIGMPGDGHPRL
jgi:hypothetical protein